MSQRFDPKGLDRYLQGLYEERYHLGRKIERSEKLCDQMKDTRKMSIADCRIYNSNGRASWFRPGRPEASTDPVYRKIGEVRLLAEDENSIANFLGIKEEVKQECIRLHKLIETRKMTGEEYRHIQEWPAKTLLQDWTQAIDTRCLSEDNH